MPQTTTQEPGVLGKSEEELRAAFLAEVETIPGGEKLRKCIQCGTCTATCPVSGKFSWRMGGWLVVSRRLPPARFSGGSLRSTPATPSTKWPGRLATHPLVDKSSYGQ